MADPTRHSTVTTATHTGIKAERCFSNHQIKSRVTLGESVTQRSLRAPAPHTRRASGTVTQPAPSQPAPSQPAPSHSLHRHTACTVTQPAPSHSLHRHTACTVTQPAHSLHVTQPATPPSGHGHSTDRAETRVPFLAMNGEL
ncbi:hypothetical protein ACOMHN_019949 [Nucella lapillus]